MPGVDMEGFDPMTMQYLESPMGFETATTAEYMRPAYAYQEPMAAYGAGGYADHEDTSYVSPTTLPHGGRHSYSSGYDEPHLDPAGQPEAATRELTSPEAPSIERGNKLLSFQNPTCHVAILDYSMRPVSMTTDAQLHGMFFLAESSRTGSGDGEFPLAELTCYRRNLFQITGSVTLPRMMQYIVSDRNERLPIVSQELVVSATESVEGNPVKIISVPWKTPVNGTAPAPEEKADKEPNSIPLDQMASHDVDAEYSIFPISWKRLQFRAATANNGRRKELQQHFTIKLSVVATLSTGAKATLCDAISGPIIVRGRSPRNFQQRKDLPLSNTGGSMRKNMASPSLRRASTAEGMSRAGAGPEIMFSSNFSGMGPNQNFEWRNSSISSASQPRTAPVSPYMQTNPELTRPSKPAQKRKSESSPVDISLTIPQETNVPQSRSAPPERPRKLARSCGHSIPEPTMPPHNPNVQATTFMSPGLAASHFNFTSSISAPSFYPTAIGGLPKPHGGSMVGHSPSELLPPDYFPLGPLCLEEWIPPVEYMYRPHIVQPRHLPAVTNVGGGAVVRGGRWVGEQ